MTRWDFLPELPDAYEVVGGRRGVLACLADWREALATAGLGPDDTRSAPVDPGDVPRGRQPVEFLTLRDEPLVVRRYTHGGLLRWLTGDRFGAPERPFEELVLAGRLAGRGIPTPEVVAARAQRAGSFGWRLCLVTRRVESAQDGAAVLRSIATGALDSAARHRAVRAAGQLVGALHAAGLWHADLTPNNLLFGDELRAGGEPRTWILDLDRGRLADELSEPERAQNLARLVRSVAKRQLTIPSDLGRSDAARFLRSYVSRLGRPAGSWRSAWTALLRVERRGRLAHRASWLLEALFVRRGRRRAR